MEDCDEDVTGFGGGGGGGGEEEVELTVPRGEPLYVENLAGPLTSVPLFQSSILQELQDLEVELAPGSSQFCEEEDISVDELKILSEEELVEMAIKEVLKDQINEMMKNYKIKNPHDVTKCDEYAKKIVELLKRDKRELIAKAERLVLKTIGFDLDIELPYKALAAALKRLTSDVVPCLAEVAWSLVEEWLKTSLCLQYQLRHIAVGLVVAAARVLKLKLPAGEKWLEELGVLPEVLDEVVSWMQSKICTQKTKETIRVVSFYEIITYRPLDSKA